MTFLTQQCVSAITGTVGQDLASFREVTDVLLPLVARPGGILLIGRERRTNRVQAAYEFGVFSENIENVGTHAGHDVHVDHDVRRVGDLDADLGDGRTNRT